MSARAAVYRGMSQHELDAAYDNARAVPDAPSIFHDWDRRSGEARDRLASDGLARLDVPYLDGERTRLDLFLQRSGGQPTLLFIHGGYWHLNSKERFSFLADGVLSAGLNLVNVGYTLAPAASIARIVSEVRRAGDWVLAHAHEWGDPQAVAVAGWSAGGHLAATTMAARRLPHALAISGIFDLEPIRRSFLNSVLDLSEEDVRGLSPARNLPDEAGDLLLAVGGEELSELRRQTHDFAALWRAAGLPGGRELVVEDRHHFAVLEELGHPHGRLAAELERWAW